MLWEANASFDAMTIVFIDDDHEDLEIYQETIRFLNGSEYLNEDDDRLECKTFRKCTAFFDYISHGEKPDVIFMDINMPAIGGKECLTKLKASADYKTVPVVMLSTTCTPHEADEFKKLGAVECIQKPSDFKDLVKIFAKYIFAKYL
jgi:CheY-like chemotaxis protein